MKNTTKKIIGATTRNKSESLTSIIMAIIVEPIIKKGALITALKNVPSAVSILVTSCVILLFNVAVPNLSNSAWDKVLM